MLGLRLRCWRLRHASHGERRRRRRQQPIRRLAPLASRPTHLKLIEMSYRAAASSVCRPAARPLQGRAPAARSATVAAPGRRVRIDILQHCAPRSAAHGSSGSRPSPQALSVRCSAAASSGTLPQSLQSLVSAFQAVPDPMAVRRRRGCLPPAVMLCRYVVPLPGAVPQHPLLTLPDTPSVLACLQRYKQLLFYATKLEPFPVEQHTEENKVKGCVSQVRLCCCIMPGGFPGRLARSCAHAAA